MKAQFARLLPGVVGVYGQDLMSAVKFCLCCRLYSTKHWATMTCAASSITNGPWAALTA